MGLTKASIALAVAVVGVGLFRTPQETFADTEPSPLPTVQSQTFERDFYLTIQTDRKVYHEGEPILVKVGWKNLTDKWIATSPDTPWISARLSLYAEGGRAVELARDQDYSMYPSTRHYTLPPHGSIVLNQFGPHAWSNLTHWGFVLGPGKYTIRGRPFVNGPGYVPDYSLRSDTVTFEVVRNADAPKT